MSPGTPALVFPLIPYRDIDSPDDEGPEFQRVRDVVTDFYLRVMRGRPRLDGPGARMKFTRDWEYPWVFMRAEAKPGMSVLDCGAGYSPLPFLWAKAGATAVALDRDAVVAGPASYVLWCVREAGRDFVRSLTTSKTPATVEQDSEEVARRPAEQPGPRRGARQARRGPLGRFLHFHLRRNQERLRRLARPDFWGPVSPRLLAEYGVTYQSGDLTRMDLADVSFDAVTCVSVLEHMPAAARLRGLREMARVLKPGGRLVITYDVIEGDMTQSLIDASGCSPTELVYFRSSAKLFATNAPDVVGMVLVKA